MTTTTEQDFNELCTSPSGILLENAFILIGVREEYEGARGCVALYFGNESKTPLTDVRVLLDPVDHLQIKVKEATEGLLEHEQGCTISVGTQAKLVLTVEVQAPFDYAPTMRVMFRSKDGMNHEHYLRLPIVATSFMTPLPLDLQDFKYQWNLMEDKECVTVLKHVPANHACMKRIAGIITKLNLEHCTACDDTPWSVSGASLFHTTNNGIAVNVLCMVRIEADHRKHRALRYVDLLWLLAIR